MSMLQIKTSSVLFHIIQVELFILAISLHAQLEKIFLFLNLSARRDGPENCCLFLRDAPMCLSPNPVICSPKIKCRGRKKEGVTFT